jgi:hypothetical protein
MAPYAHGGSFTGNRRLLFEEGEQKVVIPRGFKPFDFKDTTFESTKKWRIESALL